MPYVPPNGGNPKIGKVIKTEIVGANKYEYVEVTTSQGVEVWKNTYTNPYPAKSTNWSFSGTSIVSTTPLTEEQKKNKELEEYLKNEEAIKGYVSIGGINLYPPNGLSYKDLSLWYESRILAVIKKLQDLAVDLGKDPNEVGKALVQGTKTLSEVTSIVLASATVGSAVAGFLAVATPITAGVFALISILDGFGVFKSNNDEQLKKLGFEYNALSFILKKWYNEYAVNLSKLQQIDQIEFTLELKKKYGADFGGDTGNLELNQNLPKQVVAQTPPVQNQDYSVYIIILLILALLFLFLKNRQ